MILEVEFTVEATKRGYITVDEAEFERWANDREMGWKPEDGHVTLATAETRSIINFITGSRQPWYVEHDLGEIWDVKAEEPEEPWIVARDLKFPVANSVELPS